MNYSDVATGGKFREVVEIINLMCKLVSYYESQHVVINISCAR